MPRRLKVVLIVLGAVWLFVAGFSFVILRLF
jgi:hypothetical protein